MRPVVPCGQRHGFLEDVGVLGFGRRRGVGRGHIQHRAQLGQEKLIVGPLRRAGRVPAGDEALEGGVGVVGHGRSTRL